MQNSFDLLAAARQEMTERGFLTELPPAAPAQAAALIASLPPVDAGVRDLRALPWSSIDNDDSRDLDQIEVAESVAGGIRVRIGIADVDARVPRGCPIDEYAAYETTSVYTGVHAFPMLPERLSTDLTSLGEGAERLALVIEFTVTETGEWTPGEIYRALVVNRAALTYSGVGAWLEGTAEVPAKAAAPEWIAQLRLQDEAARRLKEARVRMGALSFDRVEAHGIVQDGRVRDFAARRQNRAAHLIEDFMIAANETMARVLAEAGVPSIRRVVKAPERWPRMMEVAAHCGDQLPAEPDSGALNAFLLRRKVADPNHYPDLSLSILKLMGPGEYAVLAPGGAAEGHFGLAAHDYTHSTAPNRRFADLVTQRLVKALSDGAAPPYTVEELEDIARTCTLKENSARKVQRDMEKRVAAVALAPRVGETFTAVVTGVVPHKGIFVRVVELPVEGRLMRDGAHLDVGDRIRVKLVATDAERGFIDFAREPDVKSQ